MKKIKIAAIALLSLLAISCTTSTTDKSYELGAARKFDTTLNYIASKEKLKAATISALTLKHWTVKRDGDAVDHRGVSGRLYITFKDDAININSQGSNINGKPIVPLRLIDNLSSAIKKQL